MLSVHQLNISSGPRRKKYFLYGRAGNWEVGAGRWEPRCSCRGPVLGTHTQRLRGTPTASLRISRCGKPMGHHSWTHLENAHGETLGVVVRWCGSHLSSGKQLHRSTRSLVRAASGPDLAAVCWPSPAYGALRQVITSVAGTKHRVPR
jgi:hypothetical protein